MRRPSHTLLNVYWAIISLMLIIGVSQPMFTFTHFYFFDDTFSLFSGIFHLLNQGELILFVLLFSFSLLMPAIKMLMLLYTINAKTMFNKTQQRYLNRIALIGKWSMLDVFVVAIMAVTIKLSMVAQVTIHYGLIVFSIGVVASMILPHLFRPQAQAPRHLVLSSTQLDTLVVNKLISVSDSDQVFEPEALLDILDEAKQWQAKAQVRTIAGHQIELLLVAVHLDYSPKISMT